MDKKEARQLLLEDEHFGANTWFVEALHDDYKNDPDSVPPQWQRYFGRPDADIAAEPKKKPAAKEKAAKSSKDNGELDAGRIGYKPKTVTMPDAMEGDEMKVIAGSAARILDNMEASLSVPVATSQRVIPVKLLEENRRVMNKYLQTVRGMKVSFTHIIAYALMKALHQYPSMNNAFTVQDGKPFLIKREHVNLGIAVDVERRDGSRSLLVPNIKKAEGLNFREFLDAYNGLIDRSRTGQIDPAEFMGTTVSLTNPGMIGTVTSIPRLMMGQGTIFAIGSIQYPAEYQAMSPETISKLGISKVLSVSSTYDHRIIQGAESGMFLRYVHELLLGESRFYDELFADLRLPLRPMRWETDISATDSTEGGEKYDEIAKQGRVRQMINMYRVRGHLISRIDPLGSNHIYHKELDPSFYGLTIWDLDRKFLTHDFSAKNIATLRQILDILQRTYCGHIGVEYMHIQNIDERRWLQEQMEPVENTPDFDKEIKIQALKKLIEAEGLERFIHTKFIGHKRFSLEGSETLIPVLDYILQEISNLGAEEAVLGMAHRGRLNVLGNIVGKKYDSILSEFEEIRDPNSIAGSGDVKYHLGAFGTYKTRYKKHVGVSIASNPSHLEWVNPVVEGIVRAKQTRRGDKERDIIVPVLIHGDAAFAGQGVVAETLNLSQLQGYRTGGTVHIIINNQIGFTTLPEDARSTEYASDVAKMIQAPIFHVNGDSPEHALWVAKLALEYRMKFNRDVVIDILCYRKHGHNEGDEPGFTQPLLYEKIKTHPSVLSIYSKQLIEDGVLKEDEFDEMKNEFNHKLDEVYKRVEKRAEKFKAENPLAVSKDRVAFQKRRIQTSIDEETLDQIIDKITTLPEHFNGHPKLMKFLEKRRELIEKDGATADWAFAEAIAFGSLLKEGVPVRLSGQDSVRGTFSQRHLALTDIESGEEYFPLNHMFGGQAKIEALDSFLSEAAVLGYEYGYSTADPLCLVLWEAQFGDFANGAQVIIDNFIVVSQEKWETPNNLVLLLPHGFEGQGPEHSSARLERFLILCAQDNMEVCYPTTPSQYYHLLRRQMKKAALRPLVVMTPKSLLRHPEARSPKKNFYEGGFAEVLDDVMIEDKTKIKRVILTSGKVYYDLAKYRKEKKITDTAIVRIEQYYPYESQMVSDILASYKNAKKVHWVQEEPQNMGAWDFLDSRLLGDLAKGQKLEYIGRPASASPAVGSSRRHAQQQEDLVKKAFE